MKIRLLFVAFLAAMISGCATPARVGAMTAASSEPPPELLAGAVSVGDVSGGRATDPMDRSDVDNEGLRGALQASLQNAGMLAPPNSARFVLSAAMLNIERPIVGLDLDVTADISYSLTEGGKQLWSERISKTYTAKWAEAFAAVERLRIANEGAIRTNIEQLIARLKAWAAQAKPDPKTSQSQPDPRQRPRGLSTT